MGNKESKLEMKYFKEAFGTLDWISTFQDFSASKALPLRNFQWGDLGCPTHNFFPPLKNKNKNKK